MRIASDLSQVLTPTRAALGNFDGVHQGHRRVIEPILAPETSDGASSQDGGRSYSTVVTFAPHPQEFFSGVSRSLLTPPREKAAQLAALGIEQLVLLPFNQALAQLSPEAFVEQILLRGLCCQRISVGEDFRFGQGRLGSAEDLQRLAGPQGVAVQVVALYGQGGDRVSSSRIRLLLLQGEVEAVVPLLGRRYSLQGEVVHGRHLGRSLGFPTANLQLPPEKFLPRLGVYSVTVSSLRPSPQPSGETALHPTALHRHPGVMNLGLRPTVSGEGISPEVHLLDWQGDLYGQHLQVELVNFLRPEQKFESLADLKTQIAADVAQARQQLYPQTSISS